MTSIVEARQRLYQRVLDNYTTTRFTFDNEQFDPPKTAWVRFVARHTSGGQETIGPEGVRRFRRRGRFVAQVFTPINQGTKQSDEIGQEILTLFEARSFSNIDTFDGVIRESGVDGEWFIHIVEIFFTYEETK